jgi:hypothetical protein
MNKPVICFGQQPCGFFPKRFLVAKIDAARKLQSEIGGRIVFFYHDSDADSRETITVMRDKRSNAVDRLNFLEVNKVQKKYSPLYYKTIAPGWHDGIVRQLPRFVEPELIATFKEVRDARVADFCLTVYEKMGLLDGIEIVRSGSASVRESAIDLEGQEHYADVPYEGEIVRARVSVDGRLALHRGGELYIDLPPATITKSQVSPARDNRFEWMQSVIHCTHYITGMGEKGYLDTGRFRDVVFVDRNEVSESDFAWLGAWV